MSVKFEDYSVQVKGALNDELIAWLHEVSNEVAAQAERNCKMDDKGRQLAGSYKPRVDESDKSATVGTPLESGYWEEFGTGEYAAHGDGRKGWWVYVKGGSGYDGPTNHYSSEEEAEAVAASMRADGYDAYATNGRQPEHTLENAFTKTVPKLVRGLQQRIAERMSE